jgi:rhodanese-related sulfurtransferase
MKEITAEALKKRLDAGDDIVLIDVREPYEHEEFNIGGELIPLAEIVSNAERFKEMEGKDIVLYCRSGNRSSMAQKMLAVQGITNTLSLRGGMNSWRDM